MGTLLTELRMDWGIECNEFEPRSGEQKFLGAPKWSCHFRGGPSTPPPRLHRGNVLGHLACARGVQFRSPPILATAKRSGSTHVRSTF